MRNVVSRVAQQKPFEIRQYPVFDADDNNNHNNNNNNNNTFHTAEFDTVFNLSKNANIAEKPQQQKPQYSTLSLSAAAAAQQAESSAAHHVYDRVAHYQTAPQIELPVPTNAHCILTILCMFFNACLFQCLFVCLFADETYNAPLD